MVNRQAVAFGRARMGTLQAGLVGRLGIQQGRSQTNIFRPWGFQPGHQTEWAKLLLILDRHRPEAWHLKRARELFDRALELSWDDEHGGMVYGFDPDGRFYDEDKYFWVQAESLAAAALLADRMSTLGRRSRCATLLERIRSTVDL